MSSENIVALTSVIQALEACGMKVRRQGHFLQVFGQPRTCDYRKALPQAYALLNAHEQRYFIVFHEWPFCLLPDAVDHIQPRTRPFCGSSRPRACHACRFHDLCSGWPSSLEPLEPSAFFDVPKEAVIEVTNDCNLRCRQCLKVKGKAALSLPQARAVVDQARSAGVKTVRITGGEPLLYPDLKDLLIYIKSRSMTCFLNTNLILLNVRMKPWLASLVDNLLVSFQGYDPKSENLLAGPASDFVRKIKHLSWARKAVPVVRIGSVISRTLLDHFDSYRKWMDFLRPDVWELYRPMSDAPGPEFQIRTQDYRVLLKKIGALRCGYPVKFANAVPFCGLAASMGDLRFFIGARADDGHSRLVYDAGGYFKPSYFIEKNLGRELMHSWNHPFAKRIRSLRYLSGICKTCRARFWCMGGSRFWAQKAHGSFFARDPLFASEGAFRGRP